MMLPETDEEYTEFALAHAGNPNSLYSQLMVGHPRRKMRAWIYRNIQEHPERCRVETEHPDHRTGTRNRTRLYIAGVWIATVSGSVALDRFRYMYSSD